MTTFSIITINLNNAVGLKKTIESVVSQTFSDFEYIVIDGASTDGSVDVIKSFESKISFWVSEKDAGIYNAMNKGIEKANGKYLLFLNSGDWLYDENVLAWVSKKNLQDDILYGNLIYDYPGSHRAYKRQPAVITNEYLLCGTILHPASFIKRTLINDLGGYDEQYKITSDYDFFLKAMVQHKSSTQYLKQVIAYHSFDGISANQSNLRQINEERLSIQKKYFSEKDIAKTEEYLKDRKKLSYRIFQYIENKFMMWKYGN